MHHIAHLGHILHLRLYSKSKCKALHIELYFTKHVRGGERDKIGRCSYLETHYRYNLFRRDK